MPIPTPPTGSTTKYKIPPPPKFKPADFNERWINPKELHRTPTYAKLSQVPFSKKRILRDALVAIIPKNLGLQLFGYHGTTIKSTRARFDRFAQTADLWRYGVSFDERGDPIPVEKGRAAAIYPNVDEWVTPAGDLLKRPSPAYGCFGVPFWRAMDLKCAECRLRDACDGVVSYRLTFGGREAFDEAIKEKGRAASIYDRKAQPGKSQGYEREAEDPIIRRLRSVYTGIWYLSDLTLHKRLRIEAKKSAAAKKGLQMRL